MAVVFLQKQKTQRNLILVLALVLVITIIVFWWGFLRKDEEASSGYFPTITRPEIRINYSVLESGFFEDLKEFSEIEPLADDAGRANPFIPY